MKVVFSFFIVLISFFSLAQSEEMKYYMNGTTIIEIGNAEKRIYQYPIVTSNTFQRRTYELIKVVSLADEPSIDPTKQKRKKRFKEISLEDARYYLLNRYEDNKIDNNSLKLGEEFPYVDVYRHHEMLVGYQNASYKPTNEPIEHQRKQIRLNCSREYDSLVIVHQKYTNEVNQFKLRHDVSSLEDIITTLSSLPAIENGGGLYTKAILDEVIEKNPEMYFTYMETVTEERTNYYWRLDKEHLRIIKKTKTKSPVKGEIRSFKTKNNLITAGIITLSTAIDAAFIGGIVYLIKLL